MRVWRATERCAARIRWRPLTPSRRVFTRAPKANEFVAGYKLPDCQFDGTTTSDVGGTRLSIMVSTLGSVTIPPRKPLRVVDRQTGKACTRAPAADGVMRCLPAENFVFDRGGMFADDACSVPVVNVTTLVPYAVIQEGVGPTTRYRVYSLDTKVMSMTVYSVASDDGSCRSGPALQVVHRGAEIAPSNFADLVDTVP